MFHTGLFGNSFLSGFQFGLVDEVVVADGVEVLVEFKNEGARRRDVVRQNLSFTHAGQVLDNGAQ